MWTISHKESTMGHSFANMLNMFVNWNASWHYDILINYELSGHHNVHLRSCLENYTIATDYIVSCHTGYFSARNSEKLMLLQEKSWKVGILWWPFIHFTLFLTIWINSSGRQGTHTKTGIKHFRDSYHKHNSVKSNTNGINFFNVIPWKVWEKAV